MRAFFFGLALVFLSVPSDAIDLKGDRWTRTDAGDLVVYSNARDFVTKSIVTNMQRMRIAVARVMNLEAGSSSPTTVFVFHSERSFAPLRDELLGAGSTNKVGVFVRTSTGYFIAMQGDPKGGIDRVVYHELTHSYHEGIADFYSTFTAIGNTVKIGLAPKSHLDFLAETGLMPLRRLFAVDRSSKEYNEAARAGSFYATSWMFVHYLLVGAPQRAGQLGTFLTLLDSGKSAEEAFRSSFATTYDQFEGEMWQYLNRPKKQAMSYRLPELSAQRTSTPHPVDIDEVLRALEPLSSAKE